MKAKKLPPEEMLQKETQEVMDAYLKLRPSFRAAYEAETDRVINIKPGETVEAPYFAELMGHVFAYMEKKYGMTDPKVLSSEFKSDI